MTAYLQICKEEVDFDTSFITKALGDIASGIGRKTLVGAHLRAKNEFFSDGLVD